MKEQEIVERIKSQFSGVAFEWVDSENGDDYLLVPAANVFEVVKFLKETWELDFDYLMNVSAFDSKEDLYVVYHLNSYRHRHSLVLMAKVGREGAQIPSLVPLYGAANFQEREVYDHFGITFTDHPDLRRILLPDDWVGYPLLKDYEEQEEYNGVGTTRPSLL